MGVDNLVVGVSVQSLSLSSESDPSLTSSSERLTWCVMPVVVPNYQEVGVQGRATSFVMQVHKMLAVHIKYSAKTCRSPGSPLISLL